MWKDDFRKEFGVDKPYSDVCNWNPELENIISYIEDNFVPKDEVTKEIKRFYWTNPNGDKLMQVKGHNEALDDLLKSLE